MLDKLKAKLDEKQKYLEQLKVEINATAGQVILLQELVKEAEKSVG